MKISVIIPTFNRANLICYTLDSITISNTEIFEIIVVDDGSTDNTEELVRSNYPTVRFIKQENQGAPTARNLGLKESKGDYVLFLDSDDLLEKDFFYSRKLFIEVNSNLDGIYSKFDFFTGAESFNVAYEVPRYSRYPLFDVGNEDKILNNLLGGWYLPICTIIWKKSFLLKIEGFQTDLIINQDVDLLFRAIIADGKFMGVDGPGALIREHQNERVGAMNKNTFKIDQVYQLRVKFQEEMIRKNIWNETYSDSLSSYCFEIWSIYRKTMPTEAKNFLIFSKQMNPNLKLKGRFILRCLSKIIGIERTVALRQFLTF